MSQRCAAIRALSLHLPQLVETNDDLSLQAPDWQMDKVASKTGIYARRVANDGETASDLAVAAAEKLFSKFPHMKDGIDYLIFCSQSPDYKLPTTACIIQDRLGLPVSTAAIDINLGCSGFIYCLSLAKALIESGQAAQILILTADTYTKLIHPKDRSVRAVFGDGAAAAIVGSAQGGPYLNRAALGSDGSGAKNLIVPVGGARRPSEPLEEIEDESGNVRTAANLFMDGREILNFTLRRIPNSVNEALDYAGWTKDSVDLVVLHQASKLVLDMLGTRLGFPANKVWKGMENIGNTVSATIPIALHQAIEAGRLKPGMRVLLCGFGVGYSWGSQAIEWTTCSLAG